MGRNKKAVLKALREKMRLQRAQEKEAASGNAVVPLSGPKVTAVQTGIAQGNARREAMGLPPSEPRPGGEGAEKRRQRLNHDSHVRQTRRRIAERAEQQAIEWEALQEVTNQEDAATNVGAPGDPGHTSARSHRGRHRARSRGGD